MKKTIHFVGIGGIGMSALARYFLSKGYQITGSDTQETSLIRELREEGMEIFLEHTAENIQDSVDLLVYSQAIDMTNPERQRAQERGIPQESYFESVGKLSEMYFTISVCGTHGKSTTTAMAGMALEGAADPLVFLGTKIFEWGKKNIRLPKREPDSFLIESCEYHNSFLSIHPNIIIVTNCEPDHLDFFGTEEAYYEAFQRFVEQLPSDGILIADFSHPKIQQLFDRVMVQKVSTHDFLEQVPELQIPGLHNRENAACVLALFHALVLSPDIAEKSLQKFQGTWRRFDQKGVRNGVQVIDDYAHHPTEIRATLSSLRGLYPDKKIWIVFQPHQYSRTRLLFNDFVQSFEQADYVLIPNVYRVRDTDEDVASVSAESLASAIGEKALWTENEEKTLSFLEKQLGKNDVLCTMGAGPIYHLGEEFLRRSDQEKED